MTRLILASLILALAAVVLANRRLRARDEWHWDPAILAQLRREDDMAVVQPT